MTMDSSFDPSIFNAPITSDISLTSLSQSSINLNPTLTITGNYHYIMNFFYIFKLFAILYLRLLLRLIISLYLELSLKKLENPKSVMIISKAQDNYVIRLTQQLVYWLVMSPKSEEKEIKASREIHM